MPEPRLRDARLYLLFTPEVCRNDPWDTLAAALAAGVDLVQWRPTTATPTADRDPGRCLVACRARGVGLIVNDDVELACEIGADGAHVGQGDMPAAAARRRLGPARWLGVSTHDAAQVRRAAAAGADHVGFGPCFPTATKGYPSGLAEAGAVAAAMAAADLPVFAIGGITAARVPLLRRQGCSRVAVCAAVLAAADSAAAVHLLRRALEA